MNQQKNSSFTESHFKLSFLLVLGVVMCISGGWNIWLGFKGSNALLKMDKSVTQSTQAAYTEGYYDAMMSIMANTSTAKRFQRDASQYGHHLNKIIAHIDSMLILNGTVEFYEPKPDSSAIWPPINPSGYTKEPLSYQRQPKEEDWNRYKYNIKSGYWPIKIDGLRTEGRFSIEANK